MVKCYVIVLYLFILLINMKYMKHYINIIFILMDRQKEFT